MQTGWKNFTGSQGIHHQKNIIDSHFVRISEALYKTENLMIT